MKFNSLLVVGYVFAHEKKEHKMYQVATAEPVLSCPPEYTRQDDRCARIVTQPLIPTCTEGTLQPNMSCLVIQNAMKQCPQEYAAVGSMCMRTHTAPATLQCPTGYHFDGQKHGHSSTVCTRKVNTPQYGCPENTYDHDDYCVSEIVNPAELSCPEGTFAQGLSCARISTYECNPMYVKNHSGHKLRALGQTDYSAFEEPGTNRELNKKIKTNHHDVITNVVALPQAIQTQTCQQTVLVPTIAACREGHLVGRQCVSSVKVNKVEIKSLSSIETAAPTATCPSGFAPCGSTHKKKGSTECCSSDEIPATFVCPAGFQLSGSSCKAVRDVDYICASSNFHKHHKNNECISTQYVDPIVTYHAEVQCKGKECNTAVMKHHGHNHGGH